MNLDRFRRHLAQPGLMFVGLALLLAVLMLGRLLLGTDAPENRVDFLPPSRQAVPDAYAADIRALGHLPSYSYAANAMTLLTRTHWWARETLLQHLPDGLNDDAALAAWRTAQQDPSRYAPDAAFVGNCSGQCLPETMITPNPGEDLAVVTRDCLTQDQAKQLAGSWSLWPAEAGLRVGPELRLAVASFSMSMGTCPVARWSLRVTDRPYPRADGG